MGSYSQISCKEIGKVLYNSTFKGRENGPWCKGIFYKLQTISYYLLLDKEYNNTGCRVFKQGIQN